MSETAIKERWAKKAEKPDGTFRPAICYHVSLSALFSEKERMLDKIRDVLSVFKENQEGCLCLWRQDPLTARELPRFSPDLWEAYRKILEEAAKEDHVILDQGASELDAWEGQTEEPFYGPGLSEQEKEVLSFCKAYYGDPSFLANCFVDAGKPVMIQDIGVRSE